MTAFIIALKELASGLDILVKRAEPWGIMFAVIGLAISIVQYREEAIERVEDRRVRKEERLMRSWTMVQSTNVSNKLRAAAFQTALDITGELTGFAVEKIRIPNLEMHNIDIRNMRFDGVRFVNGFLENSIIHTQDASRFSFRNFDLTNSYIRIDPSRLFCDKDRPPYTKFFNTNLSNAEIEVSEQMFDNVFASNECFPDIEFNSSWIFDDSPMKILIYDGDISSYNSILAQRIFVVPSKYKENYYKKCQNDDRGDIGCAVRASNIIDPEEIIDLGSFGIIRKKLNEFRVSDWE